MMLLSTTKTRKRTMRSRSKSSRIVLRSRPSSVRKSPLLPTLWTLKSNSSIMRKLSIKRRSTKLMKSRRNLISRLPQVPCKNMRSMSYLLSLRRKLGWQKPKHSLKRVAKRRNKSLMSSLREWSKGEKRLRRRSKLPSWCRLRLSMTKRIKKLLSRRRFSLITTVKSLSSSVRLSSAHPMLRSHSSISVLSSSLTTSISSLRKTVSTSVCTTLWLIQRRCSICS